MQTDMQRWSFFAGRETSSVLCVNGVPSSSQDTVLYGLFDHTYKYLNWIKTDRSSWASHINPSTFCERFERRYPHGYSWSEIGLSCLECSWNTHGQVCCLVSINTEGLPLAGLVWLPLGVWCWSLCLLWAPWDQVSGGTKAHCRSECT